MKGLELYIGGMRADLDDGSLILMNYTFEDLQSPAAVKNSYSKQLTLKGTDGNNRIFGGIFRPDRTSSSEAGGAGAAFTPSVRTPFTIYAPTGEILQSGYAKLDSVTRNGSDISYGVTLYGGLGSFLYSLMYDEDGDKLTLADLDYLGTSDPASELDFTISKAAVQEAWTALRSGNPSGKWKVVNFAACYNGVPDSDFSADKAVVIPSDIGLPSLIIDADDDNKSYTPDGNWVAISLSQEHDEWAVKDLRSYLQRPVLSVRAFIDAVCNPSNNGGYEVDISDLDGGNVPELDAWMTLPMLQSLTSPENSFVFDNGPVSGNYIALYDNSDTMPSGTSVKASFEIIPYFYVPEGAGEKLSLFEEVSIRPGITGETIVKKSRLSVVFLQAVAYDSNGIPTGASEIHCIAPWVDRKLPETYWQSPEWMADKFGYVPTFKHASKYKEHFDSDDHGFIEDTNKGAGWFRYGQGLVDRITFDIEAHMVKSIRINIACGTVRGTNGGTSMDWSTKELTYSTKLTFIQNAWNLGTLEVVTHVAESGDAQQFGTPSFEVSSDAKKAFSYGQVTKDILLGSLGTPADYLLSFCKLLGLVMTCDDVDRKITVMRRKSFFQDTVTDLSGRVDLSQQVSITPLTFAAKWYDLELEGSGGAYEENYLQRYGRAYGMQRINTGYRFDSDNVEVLSGLAFKAAASVLEYGPYWNIITDYGKVVPSVFIDSGNTYTMYDAEGNSKDFDVPRPSLQATVEYFNTRYKGYDMQGAAKLQLHDVDGKPCDGSGVLVLLSGFEHYDGFKLSDDNGAMAMLNDGTPCWDLTPGDGLDVPVFGSYQCYISSSGKGSQVLRSLDIGLPAEIGIPGVEYPQDTTIYARYWKDYIADRYSVDNKVMKCKVDMRDMRVSQELMRGFWWYADSLWLLNAITDHSLTTDDYTECELIQVREKESYME